MSYTCYVTERPYRFTGVKRRHLGTYAKAHPLGEIGGVLGVSECAAVSSYVDHRLNNDSVKFVRVDRGLWAKGANKVIDKLQWKEGDWEPSEEFPYVFLSGKVLKAPQEYTDERGKVVSAYQDELEAAWIKELKAKYPVVINEDALREIVERYK